MTVSFVNFGVPVFGVGSAGTGFSGTCTAPAGSAVGDLFVLTCSGRASGGTITVPGTYDLIGSRQQADSASTQHLFVYAKVADAGDVAGGAAVSFSAEFRATATRSGYARLTAYRDVVYIGDVVEDGVTESAATTMSVPTPPFGEGKVVTAYALRAGGLGLSAANDYTSRYSASPEGNHLQGLADGDYSTGVDPTPPAFATSTVTKLNVAFILAGTPLPAGIYLGPAMVL